MRLSKLFFRTTKEIPHEAEIPSLQLLERAGYLRKLAKGIYIYTPLMQRVFEKITKIVREELNSVGAQEISMPNLHPKELWEESGRWDDYSAEKLLFTLTDREEHAWCLAPTHEEVCVKLVSNWVTSYKQLPLNLYQIGTKFRDEIRPRFGLMRAKEFLMKDGYSFSSSKEEMEREYAVMRKAYSKIFERMELDFVIVSAHGGKIGQGKSEEFQVKADIGEDVVMVAGNFASNVETAPATPKEFPYDKEFLEKEKIATPNVATIEELSTLTKIAAHKILKTIVYKLVYKDREEFIAIGIRGDRQTNDVKVADIFKPLKVTLASDEEIKRVTKAQKGFLGPIDCPLAFYADQTCAPMTNFLAAANVVDIHFANTNWGRDCPKPKFHDFLLAEEGDACPHEPGATYRIQRGIEVGHIFNIGTKYSDRLNALFQNEKGDMQYFWMGTYGIGIGRTAAAIVEQKHDDNGIIWPLSVAPFSILITAAVMKDEKQRQTAETIYDELKKAGFDPLLDDREQRLGFKLKDSDLLGIPYKLIVGKSFLEKGEFEIESRQREKTFLKQDALVEWAKKNLK